MTLTHELIERCKTDYGVFTGHTVRAFGLRNRDLKKGWSYRLAGTEITEENYRLAYEGRLIKRGGKPTKKKHPDALPDWMVAKETPDAFANRLYEESGRDLE